MREKLAERFLVKFCLYSLISDSRLRYARFSLRF